MKSIPLAVPSLTGNERKYLNECIDTTFVSSVGPFVERFEVSLAQTSHYTSAVALSSGTCALQMALLSKGVGPNDLVILPSFTFIASANAISHCGAEPWLMDVDSSWTLDPNQVRRALEEKTKLSGHQRIHIQSGKRVAAIMPVFTLGIPAQMDELNALGKEFLLPVVCDAAAAIGARYKGRPLGQTADMCVFSFNGNKTVTSGGGGAVLSNNPEEIHRIRHIASTARNGVRYDHDAIGYNYRITNIQAAVGLAQVEQLADFLAAKARISSQYAKDLSDLPGVSMFPNPEWAQSTNWFSGIVLNDGASLTAEALVDQLNSVGIQARTFWKPVHLQKPYSHCMVESVSQTEKLWGRIVTLPCSVGLTREDQDVVVQRTRSFLGRSQ